MDTSFYTNTAAFVQPNPKSRLQAIKYLICNVDGTMTDGGIYYDESGNELKNSIPVMPPFSSVTKYPAYKLSF